MFSQAAAGVVFFPFFNFCIFFILTFDSDVFSREVISQVLFVLTLHRLRLALVFSVWAKNLS